MSAPNLDGIDLRLLRSDEHFQFLAATRGAFQDYHCGVVGEFDAQSGDYVFRLSENILDPYVGIVVGEYVQALRNCLDNLIWQLTVLRQRKIPRAKQHLIEFPIYEDEPQVVNTNRRAKAKGGGPPRDPWRGAWGVAAPDLAFIKLSQPYKLRRPGDVRPHHPWHPLAILRRLSNVDKHRYVHAAAAAAVVAGIARDPVFPIDAAAVPLGKYWLTVGFGRFPMTPFYRHLGILNDMEGLQHTVWLCSDDPTEVCRMRAVGGNHPKMEMDPSPALDISFGDREFPVTVDDLLIVGLQVRAIIQHFRGQFSS